MSLALPETVLSVVLKILPTTFGHLLKKIVVQLPYTYYCHRLKGMVLMDFKFDLFLVHFFFAISQVRLSSTTVLEP